MSRSKAIVSCAKSGPPDGSWAEQEELEPYRSLRPCATCRGQRLKAQSLAVKVKGRTIADYVDLPIAEALTVFEGLQPRAERGLAS